MFYFTVLLLLQVVTFIHGGYQGKAALVRSLWEYYGMIEVGENNQVMLALFDTGSNHLWVVTDEKPIGHIKYPNLPFTKKDSTTFLDTKVKYEEKYLSGKIFGYLGNDKIVVKAIPGGIDLGKVEFGVVEDISNEIVYSIFYFHCALFGLNLVSPELIPGEPTPSLELLVKNAPVFGFFIHEDKNRMVYGPPDPNLITGELTAHDVVKINGKYNGWNVNITKIQIEKLDQNNYLTGNADMYGQIITRSGSLLAGPMKFFKGLVSYLFQLGSIDGLQQQMGYPFDCDVPTYQKHLRNLPILSVFIDDVKMDIEPEYYLQRSETTENCRFLVVPRNIDYIIIGNPFIKKYYTQFDYNKKQVSFALANHNQPLDD